MQGFAGWGGPMNTVLLALLCVGFVIGVVCCCMGLYLVILRMRGVPKLGDVPGIGEIGTLQSGASLVLIGAYCFYYALSTYLPLQNGAVLQQRVDKLLVETSRDLRKEYNDVKGAAGAAINPEAFARANFLISFLQRIDDNNGHAFYFSGEVRRRLGKPEESHSFFYRYLEEQAALGDRYKEGGPGAEICYRRPRGFCAQRSGWIHHLLAIDFFKKAMAASERAEKRVHLESTAQQAAASLDDFPQGFVQEVATKVLQSRVAEELKKLGDP
jgi:hypothetical protein